MSGPEEGRRTGAFGYVTELNGHDVLLGRGAPIMRNPGNLKYNELVKAKKDLYTSTGRHVVKDEIARRIYRTVSDRGGRFLKKVESSTERKYLSIAEGVRAWAIANEAVSVQKVKQALRERAFKPDTSDSPNLGEAAAGSRAAPATNKEAPRARLTPISQDKRKADALSHDPITQRQGKQTSAHRGAADVSIPRATGTRSSAATTRISDALVGQKRPPHHHHQAVVTSLAAPEARTGSRKTRQRSFFASKTSNRSQSSLMDLLLPGSSQDDQIQTSASTEVSSATRISSRSEIIARRGPTTRARSLCVLKKVNAKAHAEKSSSEEEDRKPRAKEA